MNNYCRNCGEKLNGFDKCEHCGTKILKTRLGDLNKILEKKYINIFVFMIIIYIIFNIIFSLLMENYDLYRLFSFIYPFINLLPLILIIFIIYAKKTLKYSKFFNIVYWLMIFFIIIFILFILFVLVSCEYQI